MKTKSFGFHIRETLALSIPIIASRAGAQVLTLLNLSMVGKFGASQLSYFALATAPYFTLNLVGISLLSGVSVEVAKARAVNDFQGIKTCWRAGICIWALFSALVTLTWVAISHVSSDSSLTIESHRVLFLLGFGAPAFIGYFLVANLLEGLAVVRPAAVITGVALAVNLMLNTFFLSHLSNGKDAALWVTFGMIIVRWAMFLSLLFVAVLELRKPKYRVSSASKVSRLRLSSVVHLIRFGGPVAFSFGIKSAAGSALTIAAAALGSKEVAVFAVATQLVNLSNMVANGISNAAIVRVSHFSGLKERNHIRQSVGAALTLASVFLTAVTFLILFFPTPILRFFTQDFDVSNRLNQSIEYLVVFFAVDCFCTVLMGSMRPLGDRWVPQTGFGVILFLVGFPLGYLSIHAMNWGIMGVFAGMTFSYLCAAAFVLRRARQNPYLLISTA
jgi:MATE family multidrug resistance protein